MWRGFLALAASWSSEAIIIRLIISVIVGIIIGFDRAMKRRGAGIKTHSLVCLGAAVVMITGQYVYYTFPGNMDITRLGAQVVSGVGFLGVGTILVTGKNQVRGLTTAAGLWACACFGLAVGVGFVEVAIYGVVLSVVIISTLSKVDDILRKRAKIFDVYIEFTCNKSVTTFVEEMKKENMRIAHFELGKSKIAGEGPNAIASILVTERG
ncbi:MAG: MgtC/SapB family protein, partial [Anaerotignaceae bacterium]